jgi:hypothetical protein
MRASVRRGPGDVPGDAIGGNGGGIATGREPSRAGDTGNGTAVGREPSRATGTTGSGGGLGGPEPAD